MHRPQKEVNTERGGRHGCFPFHQSKSLKEIVELSLFMRCEKTFQEEEAALAQSQMGENKVCLGTWVAF